MKTTNWKIIVLTGVKCFKYQKNYPKPTTNSGAICCWSYNPSKLNIKWNTNRKVSIHCWNLMKWSVFFKNSEKGRCFFIIYEKEQKNFIYNKKKFAYVFKCLFLIILEQFFNKFKKIVNNLSYFLKEII